ncbi:hypothetical protein COY25_04585 [Candidatus Uhrbacteria bacterium CG_4_10_14_0_2_um_filter_41_7]|uniref:DUF2207 domain-containing protein n=1 Tax=Candidatus Uhrbacteria bacterium CG_4_9_14_3_um_filter_41_35 TaxID=1975034 RepID=A0A2M7XGQ0_9BACT|nr:MAG: hypothetical protein COV92_03575 [Candidatus Uhrbacteria bacterium CG11_big_fil_rev_8_21_14_0_20_41_9]PIZ52753.1 MAG: hypothetical protein COY25_04585 [Candidatus Uhrbacteria bacterium CG_4_10_14_0_2_um_filter_41_7]PJA47029.1 MAG: hypothetical protein CO173_00440 [Candidatus Uhrbacteria bacterium CG_4_9_14_3_um_filter_41_35]
MRKFLLIITAVLLFGITRTALAQEPDFTIHNFHADLTIKEDGSLLVVETISGDFLKEKHGIIRYIPVVYDMSENLEATTDLALINIKDISNTDVPYSTSTEKNDFVIRIGDPNKTISGRYEYTIEYTVRGAFMYFDDHDELYWNVTGNNWPVAMKNVSASIHLPPGAFLTGKTCFTGKEGSTVSNCSFRDSGIKVEVTATDYLTLAIGFTPNVISEVLPTIIDKAELARLQAEKEARGAEIAKKYIVIANLFWLSPILIIAILKVLSQLFWPSVESNRAVIAEFKAPDELRPTELAVLLNGKIQKQDMSAFVVDMAVRGYLKISESNIGKKTNIAVIKLKEADSNLRSWEEAFFTAMFRSSTELDHQALGAQLSTVIGKTNQVIINELVLQGYLKRNHYKNDKYLLVLLFIYFLILAFSGLVAMLAFANFVPFFAMFITGLLLPFFRPKLIQYTEKGAEAAIKGQGLKLFINTAERYRLKWQEQENIFEELLPYAMIFKITDKWSKVFHDFYAETNQVRNKPDWYSGSNDSAFDFSEMGSNLANFSNSLPNKLRKYGSGASYARSGSKKGWSRSGSGFSGHGSSGGGFGGGGGGSW